MISLVSVAGVFKCGLSQFKLLRVIKVEGESWIDDRSARLQEGGVLERQLSVELYGWRWDRREARGPGHMRGVYIYVCKGSTLIRDYHA